MDRRGPRFVIDPKVRQVGFVTPGSDAPIPAPPPFFSSLSSENPTPSLDTPPPVIIPPRLPDLPSKTSPRPVPSPPPRKHLSVDIPLQGSYNPPDSVLGSSPGSSPVSNGKYVAIPSSEGRDISPFLSRASSAIQSLSLKEDRIESPPSRRTADFAFKRQQEASTLGVDASQALAATGDDGDNAKPLKERTTKAERRAKQEADREAKRAARENAGIKATENETGPSSTAGKSSLKTQNQKKEHTLEKKVLEKLPEKEKRKDIPAPRMQFDDEHRVAKAKKKALFEQTETKNRVELFRHLPQYVHGTQLPSLEAKFFHDDAMHPHPAIYQVGLQYVTSDVIGGNARCVAMLSAFQDIIKDYSTPKEKTLVRDLTARINSNVSFLNTCRPLSISMGNAIKFVKMRIAKLPVVNLSETELKAKLVSDIDQFIQEKIAFAAKEITKHAVTKIKDGDVILTYGSSCIIESVLLHAFDLGLKFRVIIVDSRPKLEGKGLLRRLLGRGICCTYTHINAISYVMQESSKVFLGASSILSNGTVYSRVGSACVGMVAHAFLVPVIICCETYKFHERVQLDSICFNELGDPDALVCVSGRKDVNDLSGWSQSSHLQLLNLMYDTMPADYVSMIITELGMVPPTSVPVILREYRKEHVL